MTATLKLGKIADSRYNFTTPIDLVTESIGLFGIKGGGKTITLKKIAEEFIRNRMPVCIIDLKGDWWGLRSSASGKGPGLEVVILGGDHGDAPLEPTAGAV